MLGILMNWGLVGVLTNQTCECARDSQLNLNRLMDDVYQTCTIVIILTTDRPSNA